MKQKSKPTHPASAPAKPRNKAPKQNSALTKEFIATLALNLGDEELLEVAYSNEHGGIPYGRQFKRDEIDAAVDLALKWNLKGRNIYVGGAPRRAGTPIYHRGQDENCEGSWVVWGDYDEPGAFDRAMRKARSLGIPPNRAFITGTHPKKRGQAWWFLTSSITERGDVQKLNEALQITLGGDATVTNISRLMRLPGCIAWPLKKGREKIDVVFESTKTPRHDKPYSATKLTARLQRSTTLIPEPGASALRIEEERLRQAPHLQRNDTLNKAAFRLGKLVASGALQRGVVENALRKVALAIGLEASEIEATLESGLTAGMKKARATTTEIADLPEGFIMKGGNVYRDLGDGKTAFLCSYIRVMALTRDAHNVQWGRAIELRDPDKNTHRLALPASAIGTDDVRQALTDRGFVISSKSGSKEALAQLLSQWMPPARMQVVNSLGWATDECTAFLLGDGRVIGDPNFIYQSSSGSTHSDHMHACGTLEGWRKAIARRCERNPLLLVAVSTAFAGALLDVLGAESGGIHFRGESSMGKTTLIRVGTSVWGSRRFMQSWRATDNALEGLASATNGTLLALDEIGMVDPRIAGQVIYTLANGFAKVRANRLGDARPRRTWSVMFLSSGEVTLTHVLSLTGKSKAGQEIRLLDIPLHPSRGAFSYLHGSKSARIFSKRLKKATLSNYGTAGPAFVEFLIGRRKHAVHTLRRCTALMRSKIKKTYPTLGAQAERGIDRFALIAAAGELASEAGITGWPKGSALKAAFVAAKRWMRSRGGSAATEARQAIENTRSYLSQHGASRFVRDGQTTPVSNRAGYFKDGKFYILEDAWNFMHQGSDAKRAAIYCKVAGFLLPDTDGKHLKRKAPGGGPRCYCVSESILNANRTPT